jgi:hypothetical protein
MTITNIGVLFNILVSAGMLIFIIISFGFKRIDKKSDALNSFEEKKTHWFVSEVKLINGTLSKMFDKITEIRINQKDIQIELEKNFLKKTEHEKICNDRKKI